MTLKVIHRLRTFSNAIRRIFVQHFTRFQLTVCSHGSSALAELLIVLGSVNDFKNKLDAHYMSCNQEMAHNYQAEISGTGSRNIVQ